VERDVVRPDVAAEVRVVDDDEERRGRYQHERQNLEELAQDVAVERVREGDVEPAEDGRLVGDGRSGVPSLLALIAWMILRTKPPSERCAPVSRLARINR